MRRPVPLLIAIGCLAAASAASAPVQLEVAATWDGWSRPGRIAEVELRMVSQSRVTADMTITAGEQVVHSTVQLEPGELTRLAVPVHATERMTVSVASAGESVERRELSLSLAESPLLAWAAPAVSTQAVTGFHRVEFDASALPRNAAAYSSIDALIVDRVILRALNEGQLAALLSFIARCGRTVLIDDTVGAASLLQGAVGCGGRNFAVVADVAAAPASLDRMLGSAPAELPHAATLASLDVHELDVWYLVLAVLAACAAVTALAGVFSASLSASILVPAVAAAVGLWFVQSRPVDARLLVWAETRSNDRLAQYVGLQRSTSSRRGAIDVPVMPVFAEPQVCNVDEQAAWTWDSRSHRYTAVRVTSRLFDTESLCFSGTFPVTRDAAGQVDGQGRVGLRNAGPSAWPAGMLVQDGRLQSTPVLAPGGEIQLPAGHTGQPTSAAERLAIARTPLDGLALLWPLDLRIVSQAPASAQAWLLLQVGSTT